MVSTVSKIHSDVIIILRNGIDTDDDDKNDKSSWLSSLWMIYRVARLMEQAAKMLLYRQDGNNNNIGACHH